MSAPLRPQLTPTQWRVLARVAAGESNATIATALGMGSAHETENIVRQGLANGRKGRNLPRSTCLRCRQA